jgi:hypothetical protein
MNSSLLLMPVFVPIVLGLLAFVVPKRVNWVGEATGFLGSVASLILSIAIFNRSREGLHYVFSYPALEINFNLHASYTDGVSLIVASALEILFALLLVFALPRKFRAREYFFFLLYLSGIINGILLSEEYVEMVLFAEVLFVTIYGAVVFVAWLSSYSVRDAYEPLRICRWSNSRISDLFGLGIIRPIKAFAWFIFILFDRGIDALYEKGIANGGKIVTLGLKDAHNGIYGNYLCWVVGGFFLLVWFLTSGV